MLSQDAIKNLARKYQTNELNIRREYYQHLFLSYLYQQPDAAKIYFKGGTALRILYQSPRFSEDLDFSSSLPDKKIEQVVVAALSEIEREGIEADFTEAKHTSGGYLAILVFKTGEERVVVQLEISRRVGKKHMAVTTISGDFLPAYTIVNLAQEQLVAEKIAALLTRGKPRDFYDLYFMLRANLLLPSQRQALQQALAALRTSSLHFEKELKQFLPKSHWPLIRDFPATLEREIRRFL